MAATGFTPIYLYASGTAGHIPLAANLTNTTNGSEIALNYADGNLFFKNASNSVITTPLLQSSGSQSGWLSSTDWTTFNNKAPAFTYTTNYIPYGQGTTTPTQSSNFTYNGTSLAVGVSSSSWGVAAIEVAGRVGLCGAGNYSSLSNNAYYSGSSWVYKDTAIASLYVTGDGTHQWLRAPSGTANTNISWTSLGGWDTSNNFNVNVGNVVIGTSGKGIDFSATAGTGTSELLADYEEGTWTPTDASGGSLTFTGVIGRYVKIGKVVNVWCKFTYPTNADSSHYAYVGGLPYTSDSALGGGMVSVQSSNGTRYLLEIGTGTTAMYPTVGPYAQLFLNSDLSGIGMTFMGSYQAT